MSLLESYLIEVNDIKWEFLKIKVNLCTYIGILYYYQSSYQP